MASYISFYTGLSISKGLKYIPTYLCKYKYDIYKTAAELY